MNIRIPQPAAPTGGQPGTSGRKVAAAIIGASQSWQASAGADASGIASLPVAIQSDYRVSYVVLTVTSSTGTATSATPTATLYLSSALPSQTWDQTCKGKAAFALGGYEPARLIRASSGENLLIVATGCNLGDVLTARVEYSLS